MALTAAPTLLRGCWPAMGTTARVLLTGAADAGVLHEMEAEVERLEGLWSRFRPDSDLCRVNEGAGRPVDVDRLTADLVSLATGWWWATGGLFDPTVLRAVQQSGYSRSFELGPTQISGPTSPAPGPGEVVVDDPAGTVVVPPGVGLDLGGIGKGAAADHLAEARLCPGGLVDLGGDLRVWGPPPDRAPGWAVAVEDLRDGSTLAVLGLAEGAVATSSVLRRAWTSQGRRQHHLIDPRTGSPAQGEVATVTVVAGLAAGAEVLAKAALVSGSVSSAVAVLEAHAVAGLVVPHVGAPVPAGPFSDLCWSRAGGW